MLANFQERLRVIENSLTLRVEISTPTFLPTLGGIFTWPEIRRPLQEHAIISCTFNLTFTKNSDTIQYQNSSKVVLRLVAKLSAALRIFLKQLYKTNNDFSFPVNCFINK